MNYIKQNIVDLYNEDSVKQIQEWTSGFDVYYEYYSLINFSSIKYMFENFNNHSLFFVHGGEETEKTSFQKIINNAIDDNIKIFQFNCSNVTELDDIFFAFYKFMVNNPLRRDIFRTNTINANSGSIDEQIMAYLKHSNGQLLIEFKDFEKLLDDNFELKAENLKSFFEFLFINQSIKVIMYSSIKIDNVMDVPDDNVCKIQLEGLQEDQIKDFFAIFKCNIPQFLLPEIYERTKGYLYSLRFFATAIKILNLPATAILKDISSFNGSFNQFIAKKLIQKLSESEKKVLLYLSLFRHEITQNVLKNIDHFVNVAKDIEVLKNYMFVDGEQYYELKTFLKDLIYDSISQREKIKFHEKIANFYADQIPLKPSERVIEISRTSMYTEKFYHFNISTKLSKDIELKSSKTVGGVSKNFEKKFDSQQIKYIASTKYFPDFDIKPNDETTKTDSKKDDEKDITEDDLMLTEEEKNLLSSTSNDSEECLDLGSSGYSSYNSSYFGNGYNYFRPDDEQLKANEDFYESPADIRYTVEKDEIKKAKNLLEKGVNLFRDGNLQEGIVYIKNAMTLLQNKDDESFYSAKLTLAKALTEIYKFEDAKNNINDLMACDIPVTVKIDSLIELATISENQHNDIQAENLYNQAISLANETNAQYQAAKAYFKLALLLDDKNETNKALNCYLSACQSAKESNNNIVLAAAYSNIASIYEEQNKIEDAISYYKDSLKIDEQENNYEGQTKTLSSLGNIFFNQNETDLAIKTFIKETKVAKLTEDMYMIASSFLELGDTFLALKNYKNALRAFALAKKNIDNTISTDSKNKIERRFDMIVDEIGENAYNFLLMELKNE